MKDDHHGVEQAASYETAIEKTGYGRFHYWLLFVCGLANASDAVEILCVSFLLPAAQCDLKMTSEDKGWLSAILFIGMMIGGYMWGGLGDVLGRRGVLMMSLLLNAICGAGSSLSQHFWFFLLLRFLSGIGVGGSIPVVWSYFAEFQPKHKRGAMLSFLATFWIIGNIMVAGCAWIIIPRNMGYTSESFTYNSWRIFVAVCAIPSFSVVVLLVFLPESPKFLLDKQRKEEAMTVFQNIYSINTGLPKETYQVKSLISETPPNHPRPMSVQSLKSCLDTIQEVARQTKDLFSRNLIKYTLIMIAIQFAIEFGYYGLWLWFPELFNRLEEYYKLHPNESVSVCEVTTLNVNMSTSDKFCTGPVQDEVFINSFIIAGSSLPTSVWTILHMDRLGRKFFLVLSMFLSGCSAFLILLVKSTMENLIVSCVFGAVTTMGFSSLDCLGIELFPTNLRSTAMALTLISARLGAILGNIVFGFLLDTHCTVPLFSVALLLIGGGLLGLLLPNTTQKPLL